jgi:hypothetical protein
MKMRTSILTRYIALFSSVLIGALAFASYCLSARSPQILSSTKSNITEEMIGRKYPPARLKVVATDAAYGVSEKNPVLVGGGFGKGSENTYRYLNALLGPTAERIHYTIVGTCCEFKSKHSPFGDTALLEVYEVQYDGGKPMRLYFNWYDQGKLLIPIGLAARK